ncbi:MAG: phosphate/phosphite/phosphonate ABC transporter substrate-binding protein [Elusimicrobia bacterium]|nr:phosphate/phosphite/phosphonate ABC transporter substrate-binding protein [Elusimicrobiota bacterium]
MILATAAIVLGTLGGCREKEAYAPTYAPAGSEGPRVLVFGVHPLHNPERLYADYGPIVDYVNARLAGAVVRLEASRSYDEFDKKLYSRRFDFALPNPYQTVNSLRHGYRVIGKMGDDRSFRGIVLVRRDGGVATVADLKGRAVSFPAPTALAATMMPLYYLHTHGLDARRDIRRVYSGSQESSMMNVFIGKTAAGATWPPPWEAFQKSNPAQARELVVRWETPSLVNNGLVARDDVPRETVDAFARALFGLDSDPEGRRLLAALPLERFEPATEATYAPVASFLKTYEASLGPAGER